MLIIIIGVSGSGKTTIGKVISNDIGCIFIDGDDFHSQINKEKMKNGIPLTDDDRLPWLNTLRTIISKYSIMNVTAVIACSALKESYRHLLLHGLSNIRIVYLKGDYDTISHRLCARTDHFFDPSLLQSQFDILEEPDNCIKIDVNNEISTIVKHIESTIFNIHF